MSSVIVIQKPTSYTKPTKVLGDNPCAKMYIYELPDGKKTTRIEIEKGFSWSTHIKPILPGKPDLCPATHFGYLECGRMDITTKDNSVHQINAGDTYLVLPEHIPEFVEDTVMIEFSQDSTYTNKDFLEK